jgi:hypothetical protein
LGSRRILALPVAARATLAVLLLAAGVAVPIGAHGLATLPILPGSTGSPSASSAATSPGVDPSGVLPALPWEVQGGLTGIESGTSWRTLLVDGMPGDGNAPATCGAQQTPASPNSPASSQLCFWCPSLDGGTSVTDNTNTMSIRATCPYRVVDDADLLGSPQIAVNRDDPNAVAFFSLHGGGSTQGPTPRSRDPSPEGMQGLSGDSHTTFTSQDGGRSWHDNPWGTDGYGEHITGVMDNDGNLYIGALWSKRLGGGHFDYVIKLYKEQDGRYSIATYQPSKTYSNRAAGNTIDEVNLVYLPKPVPDVWDNMTGNNTGNATAPSDGSDVGNFTNGDSAGTANTPDDRVMAVWFEKALDWQNSTTHKSSWIDASWTDTSAKDNWTRLKDDQLIGPCMAASNPVPYKGKAYVACVVDAGYKARSRARVGDIDVWSIDPKTGKTHLEERTGLVGGNPRMASRPDGYMALGTVEVKGDQEVGVHMAFGWYGRHWTSVQSLGTDLHRLAGGNPTREARITAMALGQDRNNLFFTYMERVRVEARAPDPNPNTLNPSPTQAIEYHKIIATASQCAATVLDAYDLQLGVARHPFSDKTIGDQTGVFDDLQDGMEYWRDASTGEERIYFAYGDHGVIQYGALEGGHTALDCPVTAPPPNLPPPPIPAALSTASPYSLLVGATVGTTALAMVTYLLAAKRKTLTLSTAKDKRK